MGRPTSVAYQAGPYIRNFILFYRFLDPSGRCISQCSQGFYIFVGTDSEGDVMRECRRCHDTCHTCVGSRHQDCTSCPDQLLLSDGQCVNQCPPRYSILGLIQ